MKRIETALFLTLILVLMGCTQLPISPSGSEIETQYPTITPVSIPNSTETKVPESPKNNASSTDNCLTVETNPILNWNSGGILILSGTKDIGNNLARSTGYKINMDTKERVELAISDDRLSDMTVAPNGKWLAYRKYSVSNNNANLVISSATGEQQLSIPWENEWYLIASWLDENRLVIGAGANSFLVFNPFTGERQLFQPDLPDVSVGQGIAGLTGRSLNPALDRAVYLENNLAIEGNWHYILWAIDQQRSLADFKVIIQPTAFPRWSFDGNKFAIANSVAENYQLWPAYELFSVDRDGAITQLTNLNTFYPFVYIDEYSWSSDGRYLAFWFSWWSQQPPDYDYGIPAGDRYLGIVDTENKVITNYCIQGNPDASGRIPAPVWSPDGTQLSVESHSPDGRSQVLLVNLYSKSAIRIGEDMTPVGWMITQ